MNNVNVKRLMLAVLLVILILSMTGCFVKPDPIVEILLKEGAKGQEVFDLQQRLQDLGYYTGKIDGSFGPATAAALKDFQKVNGLSVDGVAGPKTMEVLNFEDAKPK